MKKNNYGTIDKTMVLWTKLWFYGQNYGTISRTMEVRFTKEKTWQITKLRNFAL